MTALDEQSSVQREPMPERTSAYALRWAGEDNLVHRYRKAQLADPGFQYLIPWCSEDRLYPVRHARIEMSGSEPTASGYCDRCAGCDLASRRAWRDKR
jgi:hypothetical protein